MKRYISLCLLGSLVFGTAIPAYGAGNLEPAASPRIMAQSETAEAVATELISLLSEGKYEDAAAKYDVAQGVTAENLQKEWEDIIKQNGLFQQQLEIRDSRNNVVIISCEFETKTIDLFVIINDRNEAIGLNVPENSED